MARIVCQVLHRGARISFLWSEGAAFFEPYHLEGAERASLLDIAAEIHRRLADADVATLTQLGQRLYRALFRLDAGDPGPAANVHRWLTEQTQGGKIETLEFLSDMPGLIPWNVLVDETSDGVRFFGSRFSLGVGRRVNILRQNPVQVKPTLLMAADLDLIERLTDAQRPLLNPMREGGRLVHSTSSLAEDLGKQAPDFLLLMTRFDQGRLWLGPDSFSIAKLQGWLSEAREGNPDPIVLMMTVGDAKDQSAWQTFLCDATAAFSGIVANETLLPADRVFAVGQPLAQRFSEGPAPLGEILQSLRQEQGAAALAFSAFCPPQMRVAAEPAPLETGATDLPLPRLPYRPFAPYEASDRALFFGREDDTLRGALLADRTEITGLLLQGGPGVGKTSYLEAGLLPCLEVDSVGYRVLRDRTPVDQPVAEGDYPPLILRATSDLAGQFADALAVFCAQPFVYTTPTGAEVRVDLPKLLRQTALGAALPESAPSTAITATEGEAGASGEPAADEGADDLPHELWIALREDKRLLATILDRITRVLPFELVIAIDQGEELITLVGSTQQRERRAKALAMLMELAGAGARVKIVFTIRSQNFGEFVNLLPDGQLTKEWRTYYLAPLGEAAMVDALLLPTGRDEILYSSEIPYEKYQFTFAEGAAQQIVAEAIETAALEQQSPLTIIQGVGALLYDKQVLGKKQGVVGMTDVKLLGGVKSALSQCLDRSMERLGLSRASQYALRNLIGKLYISHTDGTLSRDLVAAHDLAGHWTGSAEPVEPIVNQAADSEGLFHIQQLMIGGETGVYVSLPQDGLAQLGKKVGVERELAVHGRSKIIDTLWIMIPFAFLTAAIAFFVTRNYLTPDAVSQDDPVKIREKIEEQAAKFVKEQLRSHTERTRRPLYVGLIARADQALRDDNALRARQILLEEPAARNFREDTDDLRVPDMRGFEWKYLWKQLHGERHRFQAHQGAVLAITVSPDGQRAASAGNRTDQSDDGSIFVWDLAAGNLLARIVGPKSAVHAVAFSPDGKTLASGGADKIIRLWDLSELKNEPVVITKEKKTLAAHQGAIHALAYGKDDATLASAGSDQNVILWDTASGKEKHTLKEHGAPVRTLAFSSDGKTLASAGTEATLILWDAEAGKKREAIKTPFHSIAALTISQDGKSLAAGGVDAKLDVQSGAIRFFNVADGKETRAAIPTQTVVSALAFRPDGAAVASGGKDFIIRLWNVKTGSQQERWVGHYGAITGLAFTKDGASLVSGSVDRDVKVWNAGQSTGPDVIAAHGDWVQCLALNTKNTLLASGSRDGSVKLWNPADGKPIATIATLKGAVTAIAFSAHKDKVFLAAATRDAVNLGEIKIWEIEGDAKKGYKPVEKHTLTGHTKGVTCLAFNPTPERADVLISGSVDQTVKVWNIDKGKETETHASHKDEVRCLAFAADGKSFMSGGKDRLVCLYGLDRKEVDRFPDLHLASIESIAILPLPVDAGFSRATKPDFLTGSADHTTALWLIDANEKGKTEPIMRSHFRSHSRPVSGVLFSVKPSGLVASASWDGTIKVCDPDLERYTFRGHDGPVRAIVMAADQSFLASAGNDGTIRIWRAAVDGK